MGDNTHSYDAIGVLAGLMIVFVAWVGISSILSDSQSKDVAIADLKQQLGDAQKNTLLCEGRFQGYMQGRR